jgi:predicted acyl esterase
VSAPLNAPLKIAGAPQVNLFAATGGSDVDWVVKLIDVYPDQVPSQPEMGGYELGIAMDILRGRYRESLEHPAPIPADKVEKYSFALPNANHVFLRGHCIMVRSSRAGSCCTTAIRRRSSTTFFSPGPATTAKPRSGSTGRPATQPKSICRSCPLASAI